MHDSINLVGGQQMVHQVQICNVTFHKRKTGTCRGLAQVLHVATCVESVQNNNLRQQMMKKKRNEKKKKTNKSEEELNLVGIIGRE